MAKKTSSPTPCCKVRAAFHDGEHLFDCPKCGKRWATFTAQGSVTWRDPHAKKPAPTPPDKKRKVR